MNVCEVRDLDGPNLFMQRPAIKLEIAAPDGDFRISAAAEALAAGEPVPDTSMQPATPDRVMSLIIEVVHVLHDRCDQPRPDVVFRPLEERHHYAVAFGWTHRRFAKALGRLALHIVLGERRDIEAGVRELREILASPREPDEAPEMVADREEHVPIVAITGTNGKTTTSRLLASILRGVGKTVGLTSSVGVFIDTEKVLDGDYSGPSGAHRVLEDERVEVAVLETARGGMLLRGLGFERSDVSIVTNVSADHLGLHGIMTLEGLAEVKSLVPRSTRPEGFAVLNADDPRVLAMRDVIEARPFLVTRLPMSDAVRQYVAGGGWALTVDDGQVWWRHDGEIEGITSLNDIPITFGGRAPHMVENALCAAAACLALGLDIDQVQSGLAGFRSSSKDNHGRLNVYALNGGTVVIDFAHNQAGLERLLEFSRQWVDGNGRLVAIVGTAGDREDSVFRALGRVAADRADRVVRKDSTRYLRGREPGDMPKLMREGVGESGRPGVDDDDAPSERDACLRAFEAIREGDVVAVMCIEDYDFLLAYLDEHGQAVS